VRGLIRFQKDADEIQPFFCISVVHNGCRGAIQCPASPCRRQPFCLGKRRVVVALGTALEILKKRGLTYGTSVVVTEESKYEHTDFRNDHSGGNRCGKLV